MTLRKASDTVYELSLFVGFVSKISIEKAYLAGSAPREARVAVLRGSLFSPSAGYG